MCWRRLWCLSRVSLPRTSHGGSRGASASTGASCDVVVPTRGTWFAVRRGDRRLPGEQNNTSIVRPRCAKNALAARRAAWRICPTQSGARSPRFSSILASARAVPFLRGLRASRRPANLRWSVFDGEHLLGVAPRLQFVWGEFEWWFRVVAILDDRGLAATGPRCLPDDDVRESGFPGVVEAVRLAPVRSGLDGDKISIELNSSYSFKSALHEVVDDPERIRLCRLSGKSCPLRSFLEMYPRPAR